MRLSLKIVGIVLLFVAFSDIGLAAHIVTGSVTSVTPCYTPAGYLFSAGAPPVSVIFRSGVTAVVPQGTTPKVGQRVFVGLGGTGSCDTNPGAGVTNVSGRLATYFSSSTPSVISPTLAQGPGGVGSSLQAQVNALIQSLLNRQKSPASGTSGASGGTGNTGSSGSSGGSGRGGGGIFGGIISLISLCDYGTLYQVSGTPYSGPLMWVPGFSSTPPYLYAMGKPPTPGYIIGHYSGHSECWLGDTYVGAGPVMYGYGTGTP